MPSIDERIAEFEARQPAEPGEIVPAFIKEFEPEVRDEIRRRLQRYHRKMGLLNSGAEGMTQSVWGSIWRITHKLKTVAPHNLRALAYRLSRKKLYKRNRELEKKSSPAYFEEDIPDDFDQAVTNASPDQFVATNEDWQTRIEQLPERDRLIAIMMREGRSSNEIAAQLDLTKRAANMAIESVREKLSRHYE